MNEPKPLDPRIATFHFRWHKAGEKELSIGVANNSYGWGIVARIDRLEGVTLAKP